MKNEEFEDRRKIILNIVFLKMCEILLKALLYNKIVTTKVVTTTACCCTTLRAQIQNNNSIIPMFNWTTQQATFVGKQLFKYNYLNMCSNIEYTKATGRYKILSHGCMDKQSIRVFITSNIDTSSF